MTESINFDQVAARYDATRGGEDRGRRLAADLAPLLRREHVALEVGVGTGVMALGLRDEGYRVLGLDISARMLGHARERLGNVLLRGDATRLPVRSSSMDQVYSVWVLHLVSDVRDVMDEIMRVLRPGGRYLVMDGADDPAEHHDAIDDIWLRFRAELGSPEPSGRIPGFAEHAQAAGLRVVDIVQTGPYPITRTATDVADGIEDRVQSWMWRIPAEEWSRVAPDTVAQLRALPDADEPVVRDGYQQVLVLER